MPCNQKHETVAHSLENRAFDGRVLGVALALFAGGTFLNLYHEQIEAVDMELEAVISHSTPIHRPTGPCLS